MNTLPDVPKDTVQIQSSNPSCAELGHSPLKSFLIAYGVFSAEHRKHGEVPEKAQIKVHRGAQAWSAVLMDRKSTLYQGLCAKKVIHSAVALLLLLRIGPPLSLRRLLRLLLLLLRPGLRRRTVAGAGDIELAGRVLL